MFLFSGCNLKESRGEVLLLMGLYFLRCLLICFIHILDRPYLCVTYLRLQECQSRQTILLRCRQNSARRPVVASRYPLCRQCRKRRAGPQGERPSFCRETQIQLILARFAHYVGVAFELSERRIMLLSDGRVLMDNISLLSYF